MLPQIWDIFCKATLKGEILKRLKDIAWFHFGCYNKIWGFPGGSDVKVTAYNAGHPGLIPGLRRSPGERNGNPLQYSCLENSMGIQDGKAWWVPAHRVAKSQMCWKLTQTHTHTHTLKHTHTVKSTEWGPYKTPKFISQSSGSKQVQDQGIGRFSVWWSPSSWFRACHFLQDQRERRPLCCLFYLFIYFNVLWH